MVRSTALSDPLWTDDDVAEMMALGEYRAALCPCGCGHLAEDTLSMEGVGPDFTASRVACRAKIAIIEAERALASSTSPFAAARLWSVTKRER